MSVEPFIDHTRIPECTEFFSRVELKCMLRNLYLSNISRIKIFSWEKEIFNFLAFVWIFLCIGMSNDNHQSFPSQIHYTWIHHVSTNWLTFCVRIISVPHQHNSCNALKSLIFLSAFKRDFSVLYLPLNRRKNSHQLVRYQPFHDSINNTIKERWVHTNPFVTSRKTTMFIRLVKEPFSIMSSINNINSSWTSLFLI